MAKITCATCVNEENKRCKVKKSAVALNKKRNCDKYILAPEKVKEKQILKTIKMGYKEREVLRKQYKEQLKALKQQMKTGQAPQSADPNHPLTGDLSRFTSTAIEGE